MHQITVIIPVFNSEKSIKNTLNSILNQAYNDFEILIVDDGSTDSSISIISTFNDPRIKIISQKNSGTVSAYINGIKNSNSDYIMFCDSDDFYKENFIQYAYEKITIENVDVVSFGVDYISQLKEKVKESKNGLHIGKYLKEQIHNQIIPNITFNSFKSGLTHIIPVFRFNKIYKRELLLKVIDDLNINLKQLEDNVFTTSVLLNASSIYIDDKVEYEYVQQQISVSTGYKPDLFDEYEKSILFIENIFNKYQFQIDSSQFIKLIIASTRVVLRRISKSSSYKIFKSDFYVISKKIYFNMIKFREIDDFINLLFFIFIKMKCSFIVYTILKYLF